MLYALMGLGLALIAGILNIPNFAHGALFAVGAYLTVTAIGALGNFWIALLLAPLGVALLGLIIEYAGIRRLYAAGHDYQLLFTFGLSLILAEAIILVWGPVGISQLPPPILRGGVDLGFTFYPKYRLFVMVAAGLLVRRHLALPREDALRRHHARGHREQGDGVAPRHRHPSPLHRRLRPRRLSGRYRRGAHRADPRALARMGVDMLGIAFVVVALGGIGNILGAIAAGLLVGVAQAVVAAFWTEASVAVIYVVMAAVLVFRPQGLFGIR